MSSIRVKQSLVGKLNNAIIEVTPELEDLTVTPMSKEQVFKPEKYGYSKVIVKAIESEELTIVPSVESQIYEGLFYKITVDGNSNINNNALVENPGSGSFVLTQWVSEIKDLDLSNVTSLQNSCNNFTNLTIVSIKNTDNVTNYNSFCKNSSNITDVISEQPLIGTNYNEAFRNCASLINIPEISGKNISNNSNYNGFYLMFQNCPNLSDESLIKILDMCISSTQITENKTLNFMGLSSMQRTNCKSLPNYQAFLDAGWTLT